MYQEIIKTLLSLNKTIYEITCFNGDKNLLILNCNFNLDLGRSNGFVKTVPIFKKCLLDAARSSDIQKNQKFSFPVNQKLKLIREISDFPSEDLSESLDQYEYFKEIKIPGLYRGIFTSSKRN